MSVTFAPKMPGVTTPRMALLNTAFRARKIHLTIFISQAIRAHRHGCLLARPLGRTALACTVIGVLLQTPALHRPERHHYTVVLFLLQLKGHQIAMSLAVLEVSRRLGEMVPAGVTLGSSTPVTTNAVAMRAFPESDNGRWKQMNSAVKCAHGGSMHLCGSKYGTFKRWVIWPLASDTGACIWGKHG